MTMRFLITAALLVTLLTAPLTADPCGMVPPIQVRSNMEKYLTRTGEQLTYVYFKDGIEDVVLRPQFEGKVSEFGMLIPFPSAPAIRKVSDDVFYQVKNAVNPPEQKITVPMWGVFGDMEADGAVPMRAAAGGAEAKALKYDEVRVVNQEAVGMYQVAVLQAGSTEALAKWMEKHQYIYPDGMEKPVEQYVNEGWTFVAVRARVGKKAGVTPKPGMKETDAELPENAKFDGAVQAMGFRFRVEKPVVPMRLSAYNPGELFNIVYLLTDGPRKCEQLENTFVKEQISGEELLKNLTQPLPAVVTWSQPDDKGNWKQTTVTLGVGEQPELPKEVLDNFGGNLDWLNQQRDPSKFNGLALELFASDMLAAKEDALAHHYEERHKELLNISEELGLRGPQTDEVIHHDMKVMRERALKGIAEDLKGMTLSVIEGDFPRDILRDNDLTFAAYDMPKSGDVKKGDLGNSFLIVSLLIAAGALFNLARRRTQHQN
jgi:hypothetical protein